MANTFSILDYNSTFGDWLVATNNLIKENNDIAANNYVKPSGTLFLNEPGLSLQTANSAIIGGSLQVQGVGSSVYVQNNLRVDGQIYFTNPTLGLVNYGQANIGGPLLALAPGNALRVSNNATIGVNINVGNNATIVNNAYVGGTIAVTGNGGFSNNITVVKNIYTANVVANTSVNTDTLIVNTVLVGANVSVNNSIISAPYSEAQIGTLKVIGNSKFESTVNVANNSMFNTNITVLNNTYSSNVIANNTITSDRIVANNLTIGSNVSVSNISVSSSITAPGASAYLNYIQTVGDISVGNKLTVSGDFQINGTIVYNTNDLTINANGTSGSDSYFSVNRGLSGANAHIRWYESGKYWDIFDVDSRASYSRILTANLISDSLSSTSSSVPASSLAANTLNNRIVSANTQLKSYTDGVITSANTQLKSYTDGAIASSVTSANTQLKSYVDGYINSVKFVGTAGTATPNSGRITINSTNGVTATGSSNTITINTAQDLRTSASPTFAGLTLNSPLAIGSGGTGATSQSQALTNILPTGTIAGYVLATGGPGTFYWAPGGSGGGGGTTPGTTINSSRLFPTVNANQTVFTTPTYTPGASQLRVYINGVRQFNSEYTETSNTSVTLGTGCTAGDVVLLEVDGYINNPYYANNITFTAPFGGIITSANTIQLAIQDIETRKATLANPEFIGVPKAPTATQDVANTQIATTSFVNTAISSGSSNIYINSLGVGVEPDTSNTGSILATNYITAYYSDENLKNKLGNIENALDKVSQLNGFYYEANETAQSLGYAVKKEVGVSAQEVQKVLPEVIAPAPIDNKYLTVHYERLVPLLIEAIKELKNEIDILKGNN